MLTLIKLPLLPFKLLAAPMKVLVKLGIAAVKLLSLPVRIAVKLLWRLVR